LSEFIVSDHLGTKLWHTFDGGHCAGRKPRGRGRQRRKAQQ